MRIPPLPEPFCAICIVGTEDLQPGDGNILECRRCREESPRLGRYSFSEGQRDHEHRGMAFGCRRRGAGSV